MVCFKENFLLQDNKATRLNLSGWTDAIKSQANYLLTILNMAYSK